jgi:hypothetical protein
VCSRRSFGRNRTGCLPGSEVRRVVDDFGTVRVLTPRGWRNLYEGWERSTPDVYLLVALTQRLAEG